MDSEYRGLLVDWGGVLTSDLFDSFRAFSEMATIHHTETERTVAQLESLLALPLR
jgi:hypothetical protein